MKLETQIRQLTRSSYWQGVYQSSKDCAGIRLFKNKYDFSGIQVLFLYWLKVYSMLYEELSKLEWENLDIKVIEDDDRCDAFLYYRSKQIEKQIRKSKIAEKKSNRKTSNTMKIFSGKNKEGDK